MFDVFVYRKFSPTFTDWDFIPLKSWENLLYNGIKSQTVIICLRLAYFRAYFYPARWRTSSNCTDRRLMFSGGRRNWWRPSNWSVLVFFFMFLMFLFTFFKWFFNFFLWRFPSFFFKCFLIGFWGQVERGREKRVEISSCQRAPKEVFKLYN